MNDEIIEIIEDYDEVVVDLTDTSNVETIETDNESESIVVNRNYNLLQNQPKVNNVTLKGNLSLEDLGITEYDDTEIKESIEELEGDIDTLSSSKADVSSIPTKISQLQNDSGFISEVPSEYITEDELSAKGYLTSVPSTYKTKSENDTLYQAKGDYALRSEIPDTSSFITRAVDDLQNYYLKSQTYTKQEVNNIVDAIQNVKIKKVDTLPATGETNIIYFVPKSETSENDVYDEYIYINDSYEKIGSTEVDLSDYYTKEEVDGKGYLTNTNYASSTVAGVIKAQSAYGLEISQSGILLGKVKTNDEYQSGQDKMFISKGTLENVITGKGLVDSSYHDNTKQDVINDLDTIRSGASAGATALQSVPSEYAKKSDVPTKTSELTNDSNYLTEHQKGIAETEDSSFESNGNKVINMVIKGNVEQDGTPTLDEPIEVKTFKGYNKEKITIEGKTYDPYCCLAIKIIDDVLDDEFQVGTILSSSGRNASSTTRIRNKKYSEVKSSTLYRIESKGNIRNMMIYEYGDDNSFIKSTGWVSANYDITTQATTKYIRLVFENSDATMSTSDLEYSYVYDLNESSIDYINLNGNEALTDDYVYLKNGKAYLHKAWGKVVLDGSEDWSRQTTNTSDKFRFRVVTTNTKKATSASEVVNAYSNCFKVGSASNTWECGNFFCIDTNDYMFFYNEDFSNYTLDQFKIWLSTNKPVVYYQLETPQEIDLGYVELKTINGMNNVKIFATLEPSDLNIRYFSDSNLGKDLGEVYDYTFEYIENKQDISTLETDVKAFINKTYITSLIDDGDGVNY